MTNNNAIGAFLERVKEMFSKKSAACERPARTDVQSADALRTPSASQTRLPRVADDSQTSSQPRMQSLSGGAPDSDSASRLQAMRQNADGGYQASRGGDQATRRPPRQNSTYVKLQSLSASGIGATSGQPISQDETGLNSLLERLENS